MRKKALFTSLLIFFFSMVGYSLTILFTPLFITPDPAFVNPELSLSIRTILLGLVMFLYPFGQFCSSPILGALSDSYGRRLLLILSVAVMVIAYGLIAWALQIKVLYFLMAALFLAGLSGGNVVIAFSVVADLIEDKERGRFFGYIYLFRSLGYLLGPLIGGKLADHRLVPWFDIATPFWAVFFLLLICFIWMLLAFPETLKSENWEKLHIFQAFTNIKSIFTAQHLRFYFLINFLVYLSIYGFFRGFPIYLVDKFSLNISKLSEFIALQNLPIILVFLFLSGWISKRMTFRSALTIGALSSGIFMLTLILPNEPNEIWLPLFFTTGSFALALPGTNALLSSLASKKEQGRVLGNNQSLQVLGEALSALAAGLISSIFIKLSIISFGVLIILAAILLTFIKSTPRKVKPGAFTQVKM
ncbi:MAG: MFS transporter [Chlamydiales bacterium]|nr:MFS transporter [Chlamydiales bacterium]